MTKIKIGISCCLLGKKVRYDGGHKLDSFIANTLAQYFDFVAVCPEYECGLGVPREPMQLTGEANNPRLIALNTRTDHTNRMVKWAEKRLRALEHEDLWGFIFKTRSPSCGIEQVKVYAAKDMAAKTGAGIFARLFMSHFPYLPVEEEERLAAPEAREKFIDNIFVLKEWREAVAGNKLTDLLKFHARMKYSFMARSPALLGRMGRLLAGHRDETFVAIRDSYYVLLEKMLRIQSTAKLNLNVLQHIVGYFKKQLSPAEKAEFGAILQQYRAGRMPLILPITLITHYARKYASAYLVDQHYLNPHPLELLLRNHV